MATKDQDSMQTEIIREVEAEMKEEQLKKFWKKYSTVILIVIVIALAGTGAFEFYKNHKENQALLEASQLETAINLVQEGKNAEAAELFKQIRSDSSSGYRYLAALHYVDLMLMEKNDPEAIKGLDAIIQDKQAPQSVKNMALFNKVSIAIDLPGADYPALETELAPLGGNDTAWTPDVLELTALIALRQNDVEKARACLQRIIGLQNISDAVRQRATDNLSLINKQFPVK